MITMSDQLLVETYKASLPQKTLWPEYDAVMRAASFQSVSPEFDKAAVAHWWMNTYWPDSSDTPQEVYKSWHSSVYANFKYITISGFYYDSRQSVIQVRCYLNTPIEPVIEELQYFLPHIKNIEFANEQGKVLGIFESTLCQHGVYSLLLNDKISLYCNRRVIETFDTLEKSIEYIRANHWYQRTEGASDDDEGDEEDYD